MSPILWTEKEIGQNLLYDSVLLKLWGSIVNKKDITLRKK